MIQRFCCSLLLVKQQKSASHIHSHKERYLQKSKTDPRNGLDIITNCFSSCNKYSTIGNNTKSISITASRLPHITLNTNPVSPGNVLENISVVRHGVSLIAKVLLDFVSIQQIQQKKNIQRKKSNLQQFSTASRPQNQ